MKKAIWTVSFIAIVFFTTQAFAGIDDFSATQASGYSDILPEDSVLVISFPNIDEVRSFFNDPAIERLIKFIGVDQQYEAFRSQMSQQLLSEVGISLEDLYNSFTGDLTFALMNFSTNEKEIQIALMAGIKGGDVEASSLIRAFASAAEEHGTAVETKQIAGKDVIEIAGDAYFAAGKGHLILSNKAEAISKLLTGKTKLSDNPVFMQHRKLAGLSKGFSFYANLRPIIGAIKTAAENHASTMENGRANWVYAVFSLFGLDYLDSVSFYLPLGENDQFKLYIRAPNYSGIFTGIFSGTPVGFKSAESIPDYYDGFFALSIHEPLEIMNSIIKTISMFDSSFSEEKLDAHFAEAKEETGIDVKKDLIAPFGSTIAGGIKFRSDYKGNIAKNPFAVLEMLDIEIVFSLKDPARLLSALKTLTVKESDISVGSESYNGATLFSFNFHGAPQMFSLAIVNSDLILKFGDDAQMKMVIDDIRSGKTIANNAEFRANKGRISPNSFALGYYSKDYFSNVINVLSNQLNTKGMPDERAKLAVEIKDAATQYFATKPSAINYAEVLDDGLYSQSDFSLKSFLHMLSIEILSGQFGQFMDSHEDQMNTK